MVSDVARKAVQERAGALHCRPALLLEKFVYAPLVRSCLHQYFPISLFCFMASRLRCSLEPCRSTFTRSRCSSMNSSLVMLIFCRIRSAPDLLILPYMSILVFFHFHFSHATFVLGLAHLLLRAFQADGCQNVSRGFVSIVRTKWKIL